jgi:DNA-binding response OmpR family regulator
VFKKVLIIDDEKATVDMLSRYFQIKGFQPFGALRGEDGLTLIRVEQPDVVICDLMMPDMNGHEVCRRIRADPATAYVGVLLLTAKMYPEGDSEAQAAGADGFMNKPVRFPELLAELERIATVRKTE